MSKNIFDFPITEPMDFSEEAIEQGILALQTNHKREPFIIPFLLDRHIEEAIADQQYYAKYIKYPYSTTSMRKLADMSWNFAEQMSLVVGRVKSHKLLLDQLYALCPLWLRPWKWYRKGRKRIYYKELIDYLDKRVDIMQQMKVLWGQ